MINSLYVHIPFCKKICNYCDFSKVFYSEEIADKYLENLKLELDSYNIKEKLSTIYIGGGTPTCLSSKQLTFLLSMLEPYINKNIDYEFTIECNPNDINIEKIFIMKKFSVNRISLGVQTFNNRLLKSLDRSHNFDTIRFAVDMFQHAGFNNISIDLIYGLPKQTKRKLKRDLKMALKLRINHISTYSLQVEPNTVFYLKGVKEFSDASQRKFYDFILGFLRKNNFIRYEVSNFAIQGFQSKHNLTYWNNNEYYAIGLNAHGYVNNVRYSNTKSLTYYNQGNIVKNEEIINNVEKLKEEIMLKFRLKDGINFAEFKIKFDLNFQEYFANSISYLKEQKLLEVTNFNIFATDNGIMLLDNVIRKFLDDIKEG